jgi:N-acyl amino acid synthase of PEP-CTERM/exosortase system
MFPFDIMDLGVGFRRLFEIVPALSEGLREEAYRIRHQVYCEELGFEPARADGRETDGYDAQSIHCLIRAVRTGKFVGCTRLVLTRDGNPGAPLPFERTCERSLDRSIVDPGKLQRRRIAEVSRLAIIADYRNRTGEREVQVPMNDESFGDSFRPRFPYIPVGLYLGTIELARLHGVDTLFVLTEPRLAKHFARLGVDITQIGEPVEHRGTRVPSMMSVSRILDGLNFMVRPLYSEIAKEVQAAAQPAAVEVP